MLSLIKYIINLPISKAEEKRLNMYNILNKYDLSKYQHIKKAIYTYINLNDEKIINSKESIILEIYIEKMINKIHNKNNLNCKYKFD